MTTTAPLVVAVSPSDATASAQMRGADAIATTAARFHVYSEPGEPIAARVKHTVSTNQGDVIEALVRAGLLEPKSTEPTDKWFVWALEPPIEHDNKVYVAEACGPAALFEEVVADVEDIYLIPEHPALVCELGLIGRLATSRERRRGTHSAWCYACDSDKGGARCITDDYRCGCHARHCAAIVLCMHCGCSIAYDPDAPRGCNLDNFGEDYCVTCQDVV